VIIFFRHCCKFQFHKWGKSGHEKRETGTALRKKEGISEKVNGLKTNSKVKTFRDLYRSIIKFIKFYRSRTDAVKDENDNVVTDSQIILDTFKNCFYKLLNVHDVNDFMHTEMHKSFH